MEFEKLADARLDAGWQAVQRVCQRFCARPESLFELLNNTYDSLDTLQKKLYLYSPQVVFRVDRLDQIDAALLFEPPRLPDHRHGLEHGLRTLLTWLVAEERREEAQGWANLSRLLGSHLDNLDYLSKSAQLAIFCIGENTSRCYLNLQPLSHTARRDLLSGLESHQLYERVERLAENEDISLGGIGVELQGNTFRTKLYLRGRLSILSRLMRAEFANSRGDGLTDLDPTGFIHSGIDAEVALEACPADRVREKWVCFTSRSNRGVQCASKWLAKSRHWPELSAALNTLGGDSSLFALGMEAVDGAKEPARVNLYTRPSRE